MADGDVIYAREFKQWKLIDAAAATDNGVWIDTAQFGDGDIEVTISGTATVQIRGSSAPTIPANASHVNQIGSDVTASGDYDMIRAPRWLKARVSAWSSGTVNVYVLLRPQRSAWT